MNGGISVITVLPQTPLISPQQPFKYQNSFTNQSDNVGIGTCVNSSSVLPSSIPEITYHYADRLILPKGPIPLEPQKSKIPNTKFLSRKHSRRRKTAERSITTPLRNLIRCLCDASQISRLSTIFSQDYQNIDEFLKKIETEVCDLRQQKHNSKLLRTNQLLTPLKTTINSSVIEGIERVVLTMLPSMPQLGIPIKTCISQDNLNLSNNENVSDVQNSVEQKSISIEDSGSSSNSINESRVQDSQNASPEPVSSSERNIVNDKVS